MVIDIDSFLDNIHKEQEETKSTRLDLDFQKDVEDRLVDIRRDTKNGDLALIKEIYEEVKTFNVDLPNKFLGLENKGGDALVDLGQKYSKSFYEANTQNAKQISLSIKERLSELKDALEGPNFTQIFKIYKEIVREYSYFPNHLLNEKIPLGLDIRDHEVEIFNILEKYKHEKTSEFQALFSKIFESLREAISRRDIKDTEISIKQLQETIESIPQILVSNLIPQRRDASKILRKAEEFLLTAYKREFSIKKEIIDNLFEKFHSHYVNKNINGVLLVYNEIVFEFESLPDTLLEEKMHVYSQINVLYEKLNKLMVNRNIFMLMESYEYGKRIESIREYLRHVELTKTYNPDNLAELKNKIRSMPKKFAYEVEELDNKIDALLKEARSNPSSNRLREDPNNREDNLYSSKKGSDNKSDHILDSDKESILEDEDKKYLKEIDRLYHQFKLARTPDETKVLYKKIIYAINIAPIDKGIKSSVVKKLNKTLYQKKLI